MWVPYIFNDFPNNSDARPGLGATDPSDKDREVYCRPQTYTERTFSNQLDKGEKVSTSLYSGVKEKL